MNMLTDTMLTLSVHRALPGSIMPSPRIGCTLASGWAQSHAYDTHDMLADAFIAWCMRQGENGIEGVPGLDAVEAFERAYERAQSDVLAQVRHMVEIGNGWWIGMTRSQELTGEYEDEMPLQMAA